MSSSAENHIARRTALGKRASQSPAAAGDRTRLRLMIVDDGAAVTPRLMQALTGGGFNVQTIASQEDALEDARGERYEAIVINSDFDGVDALWLCLELRAQGCLSVIVIVSRRTTAERQLAAFRAGATDQVRYVMPRQLLVRRILAQIAGAHIQVIGLLHPLTAELPTDAGLLTMSLVPTILRVGEQQLSFTRIEERLIARLWAGRGAVVSDDELIASGWFDAGRSVSMKTVAVHLSHLRRKLRRFGLNLEYLRGRGYRLALPPLEKLRRSSKVSRPKD